MKYLIFLLLTLCQFECEAKSKPFIKCQLNGRLGNQLFQTAAALNLAYENNAVAVFPDFKMNKKSCDNGLNFKYIFKKQLYTSNPKKTEFAYGEAPNFTFEPIKYQPNMTLVGYYQSEKYFLKHKDKILPLFKASKKIKSYLNKKYKNLLAHPKTVGCHLRAYKLEDATLENFYVGVGRNYIEEAVKYFPEDAYFVFFSDNIEWAKKVMEDFPRPHVFIEKEAHYHDFYLMSFCKHQIISNSTFSWWAAYLNQNPDKTVIAPSRWFLPKANISDINIIPPQWIKIDP